MRKALVAGTISALLLFTACETKPESGPSTASETTVDTITVLAQSDIDYDRDGSMEKLEVRMLSGGLKEEQDPGPYTGQYWEGTFQLLLSAEDGTPLHMLDLNSTFGNETLIFDKNRAFDIAFADYNNDGYSDFAIGQYFSSNGFTYNIYSLQPEGIIVLHRDLFTAAGEYSILYDKAGNTSFRNRYYDMDKGVMKETLFTWQGDKFVRTECEGCDMSQPAEKEQWLLSEETEVGYDRFVEKKEDELLRGLSPLDVFKFYVKASEEGDYETQYALYIKDPDYDVPSYKAYVNEISRDQEALDRAKQMWAEIKGSYGLTEEIEGDQALIRISNVNDKEGEKGFQLIKSKGGIWKVAWLPMQ
ncbi:FG-GAP repeat protein [Paenibacillaceae bacterium WGS1546]|uniref:FG-GAP repeat protein n=1 Tax=Cohnella sp. WGS1546 TaxID=3366810 RepID=UPI00372D13E4